MQGFWADYPSSAFRDLPADQIAVLPLGAIEQHGPHLPLSVDRDIIEAVIARMLPLLMARQNVLILPTLTMTKSNEHSNFPGTLTLSVETLLAVLRDLMASLARAGVQRLVFFNGHGGNTALLEIVCREGRVDHGLITAQCSWYPFADLSGFDPKEQSYDLHAGESETAAMLAAKPDLVDMSKAQNFRTAMQDWEAAGHQTGLTGQAARPGWIIEDLNADGACGNALAASAQKGEQLLSSAAQGFAAWLADFQRFEPRR